MQNTYVGATLVPYCTFCESKKSDIYYFFIYRSGGLYIDVI